MLRGDKLRAIAPFEDDRPGAGFDSCEAWRARTHLLPLRFRVEHARLLLALGAVDLRLLG